MIGGDGLGASEVWPTVFEPAKAHAPPYDVLMSADPIIYCLERLTDYVEYEKLCCALLAHHAEYPDLIPMGGIHDGGRDAVVIHYSTDELTGFAFSVRADWLKKFKQDAKRLHDTQGDKVKTFVYVSTNDVSASDHDKAREHVQVRYGWPLKLFDIKWMRTQLVRPGSMLVDAHPTIFPSKFFPRRTYNDRAFVQDYLSDHAPLLDFVSKRDAQLAVEVDVVVYMSVQGLLWQADVIEANCFDKASAEAINRLHVALANVWAVISDENYIHLHPDSPRVKFNNDASRLGCQAVLARKRVEIAPLLEVFGEAYRALVSHAKNP